MFTVRQYADQAVCCPVARCWKEARRRAGGWEGGGGGGLLGSNHHVQIKQVWLQTIGRKSETSGLGGGAVTVRQLTACPNHTV